MDVMKLQQIRGIDFKKRYKPGNLILECFDVAGQITGSISQFFFG